MYALRVVFNRGALGFLQGMAVIQRHVHPRVPHDRLHHGRVLLVVHEELAVNAARDCESGALHEIPILTVRLAIAFDEDSRPDRDFALLGELQQSEYELALLVASCGFRISEVLGLCWRVALVAILSSAFLRGFQTSTLATCGFGKSYSHADHVPSSNVTRVPRSPPETLGG